MSVFLSSLTATILTAMSSSSKLSFTFVNSTQTQRPHYRVKFENEALFLRPISRAIVHTTVRTRTELLTLFNPKQFENVGLLCVRKTF